MRKGMGYYRDRGCVKIAIAVKQGRHLGQDYESAVNAQDARSPRSLLLSTVEGYLGHQRVETSSGRSVMRLACRSGSSIYP